MLMVQVVPASSVIFENDADVAPTVSEEGDGLPQLPLFVTVVLATAIPDGQPGVVSAKLTLLRVLVPVLLMVKVNVEVPFAEIVLGENAFAIVAGLTIYA